MDYTTLARVKSYMQGIETAQDTLLSYFVTTASRQIDKFCTSQPNAMDYFKKEDIADEPALNNVYITNGLLTVWPHKSIINTVASINYRYSLRTGWIAADMSLAYVDRDSVQVEGGFPFSDRVYVQVSYNGGLSTDTAGLPEDLQDMTAVETVRLYREARSNLGDSIGVAELGTLQYTKAFPIRLLESLEKFGYVRIASW